MIASPAMDTERERRLALRVKRINELGRVASVIGAVALAALYFKVQRDHGIAFTLSWISYFIIGHGVTRLGFAALANKADRALRAYQHSGGGTLPSATIVVRPPRAAAPEPARPPIATVPLVAPEPQPAPPQPGEGPRVLT